MSRMNNQMKDVGGSVAERLVKSAVRLVIRKPRVQGTTLTTSWICSRWSRVHDQILDHDCK